MAEIFSQVKPLSHYVPPWRENRLIQCPFGTGKRFHCLFIYRVAVFSVSPTLPVTEGHNFSLFWQCPYSSQPLPIGPAEATLKTGPWWSIMVDGGKKPLLLVSNDCFIVLNDGSWRSAYRKRIRISRASDLRYQVRSVVHSHLPGARSGGRWEQVADGHAGHHE